MNGDYGTKNSSAEYGNWVHGERFVVTGQDEEGTWFMGCDGRKVGAKTGAVGMSRESAERHAKRMGGSVEPL